jgi:lipopolysaccharide export LptBFGC system permease protein LptF
MKERAGGWILILGGLSMGLALWLTPAVNASSRNDEAQARRDFDSLVHAVSARYGIHGKAVPMMWLANLCASRITHGGVRGMKVVEFEGAERIVEVSDASPKLGDLVKEQLAPRWSPMVREHEKSGKDTFVYVQNIDAGEGKMTRLIVVDLDGKELDMVTASLNPDQLAKWMKEQDSESKQKSGAAATNGD